MAQPKMICPSYTRVLEAIILMCNARERITLRTLTKKLGRSGQNYTLTAIRELRAAGLVDFEDMKAGTIRPRVAFIPAHQLNGRK